MEDYALYPLREFFLITNGSLSDFMEWEAGGGDFLFFYSPPGLGGLVMWEAQVFPLALSFLVWLVGT